MATAHNSKPVESFENKISIKDYALAFQLYDARKGASSGKEWKASVFFVIALVMLFILLMENFNFSEVPVVSIVLLICMYMCTYYIYLLPKKAKLNGEHIYKSSKMLSKSRKVEIYRDYFVMENEYEYIRRYYTEISDCFETDDSFVLIGGYEHRINVISKKSLSDEQCEKISEHFKREMIKQYRRTKSVRKRK